MNALKKLKAIIEKTGYVDTWDYHSDDFKKPDPIHMLAKELIEADIIVIPNFNIGDTVIRLRTENLQPTGDFIEQEVFAVQTKTTYFTKNKATGAISSFTDDDIGERVFKSKDAAKSFLKIFHKKKKGRQ